MSDTTCTTCGGDINRGRFHSKGGSRVRRCLVCQVAEDLADWQPPTQRDYRDERRDEETTELKASER